MTCRLSDLIQAGLASALIVLGARCGLGQELPSTTTDHLAGRGSYHLNLTGPAARSTNPFTNGSTRPGAALPLSGLSLNSLLASAPPRSGDATASGTDGSLSGSNGSIRYGVSPTSTFTPYFGIGSAGAPDSLSGFGAS